MCKTLKIVLSLSVIISLVLAAFPGTVMAATGNDTVGTGLLKPTAAQTEWINKHFPVIEKVKLNEIALERINAERQKKGLNKIDPSTVDLAAIGSEAVYSTDTGAIGTTTLALPGAVDNSASTAFPPIRSQGGIGSCAAWATTYYQFTYETNLARGRTASEGDNSVIFSPKWTYDLINGGTDGGSYFSDAYQVEMKHGAASWAAFPYDTNYLAWPTDAATWREALNYRPQSWGRIYNSDINVVINDIKTQLANGHILVYGTYVYSWVSKTISNDSATTEDDAFVGQRIAAYMKNTNSGGHAMTLVGYNDNLWCDLNANGVIDSGEKGAFKVANSWGTSDWNSGYRWVSYDALQTTSTVAKTATWPTTDRASGGIFWSGNIFTLTVGTDYTPTMVAEVTLNTANRGQLLLTLGTGSATATQPATTWYPEALYYSGGSYAFNGTTTACDATFVMDFSDLAATTDARWFAGTYDSTAGSAATLKSYNLYQVTDAGDVLVGSSGNVPRIVDAGQIYNWIDSSSPIDVNQPPVAAITTSATNGSIPMAVTFDGSTSYDPDGQISAYSWDFGDQATASGATATHTFSAAGSYTVKLTVTDNEGAQSSTTTLITAVDPNVLNSPSLLTGQAGRGKATLSWKDNSSNESGFYIERATRTRTGYTAYQRLGNVSAGVTTYTNTTSSGTYKYRVQAYNTGTGVTSGYSNEVQLKVR